VLVLRTCFARRFKGGSTTKNLHPTCNPVLEFGIT
jgi:hypothetical protein